MGAVNVKDQMQWKIRRTVQEVYRGICIPKLAVRKAELSLKQYVDNAERRRFFLKVSRKIALL
jgi:hypothetical protein